MNLDDNALFQADLEYLNATRRQEPAAQAVRAAIRAYLTHMPAAPRDAAVAAIENAGLTLPDADAVIDVLERAGYRIIDNPDRSLG